MRGQDLWGRILPSRAPDYQRAIAVEPRFADSGTGTGCAGAQGSNSHVDLWEGEAPAEPTSSLAVSFDFHEVSGFGGSLTLPEMDVAKSK